MNNRKRKLISAVIAVVMTASAVSAVSAADYGQDPGFSDSSSQESSATTDEISDAVSSPSGGSGGTGGGSSGGSSEKKEDESEKNPEAIEDAVSSSDGKTAKVEVKSTKNLVITPSVLKDLSEGDAALEIVSPNLTISIDPETVTKASKLDLSTSVSNKKTQTKIKIGKGKKEFGCEVKLKITSCKMPAKKLAKAHVYCNGKDLGPVELDEDGHPVITVTESGTYVIK